jgi:hypothetical protein
LSFVRKGDLSLPAMMVEDIDQDGSDTVSLSSNVEGSNCSVSSSGDNGEDDGRYLVVVSRAILQIVVT